MSWIAVHDEVLGSKLRGFRKKLGCSEAEALGILIYFWLWARKNTDLSGLLGNTEKEDIEDVIKLVIAESLRPRDVVEALIEYGWLDEIEGQLYVHDWSDWQSYWYAYISKKEKDRERKRKVTPAKVEDKQKTKQDTKEKSEKPKNEKKPEKVKYAENVSMTPVERQKLVDEYGEEFAVKCIEELNNYKGANGKKYKSDYLAILNWVVERCEKKYPRLKKSSVADEFDNPFGDYR